MLNKSLKNLLDGNIESHKNEIRHIARSNLSNNIESNIPMKSEKWSSNRPHISLSMRAQKSKIENNPHEEDFTSRMMIFALGSDATLDRTIMSSRKIKPARLRAMNAQCEISDLITTKLAPVSPRSLENMNTESRSPERYNFTSPRYSRRDQSHEVEQETHDLVPHYVHPRYKTQYSQMLRFRSENVREDDQREQNLLTGTNLIHHLEIRLQKKLEALDKVGRAPNFTRLQVFGDIMSELITESWMFGPLLMRIKSAYDDEVDRVLEIPVNQKEFLLSEVEQLKNSIYHKEKLDNLQLEIDQLEEAIRTCIESEKGYASLMVEEEEKLDHLVKEKTKADEERRRQYRPMPIATAPTESEKLELLKISCWDLMDDISKMKKETQQKKVSRATIAHLSEGLQDIGIEVEKLNYHKSQLLAETNDMKEELFRYVNEDEMTEADFRLIETVLSAPSQVSLSDYEESSKWTWYIS